jgi:hypothetical protein
MRNRMALVRSTAGALAMTLIAAFALTAPAPAGGQTDYAALVAQVKSGEKDVDYGLLREAYVKSPDYDPYSVKILPLVHEMGTAASRSDFEATLALAKRIIAASFIVIDAHLYAAVCYDQLGQPEEAKREREIGHGLVKAILSTGDGKSPETAFTVVTVAEEYSMLLIMKARRVRQALIRQGGHSYDRLDVAPLSAAENKTAPEPAASLYFQIDPIIAKTGAMFRPDGGKAEGGPQKN